jgi:hypothetical protein
MSAGVVSCRLVQLVEESAAGVSCRLVLLVEKVDWFCWWKRVLLV